MEQWYMLTLVGKDRPGIVAQISTVLCLAGCNLGEASMSRLGDYFTVMLIVRFPGEQETLEPLIKNTAEEMNLRYHLDEIEGGLHFHIEPNVRIAVKGPDRKGIVEEVTQLLSEKGLNILNLDCNLVGTESEPIYSMSIEGTAAEGIENLYAAVDALKEEKKLEAQLIHIPS